MAQQQMRLFGTYPNDLQTRTVKHTNVINILLCPFCGEVEAEYKMQAPAPCGCAWVWVTDDTGSVPREVLMCNPLRFSRGWAKFEHEHF